MSWSGLANNQCISFNNLQDGVSNAPNFVAKQAIPASAEQITKTDANDYVYIDTSYSPYASKASNQLVVKTDLVKVGFIDISLAATYANVFEMTIVCTVSAALPADLTISFDWCTDSGAAGNATFTLPAGFSGSTDIPTINLSSVNTYTGTYGSADVTTASGTTVTEFYVKGSSVVVTTTDTTRPYSGTWDNVDNTCGNQSAATGECIKNCYPIYPG